MDLSTLLVIAFVALLAAAVVFWVLREVELAVGWLSQPGPGDSDLLQPQDMAKAQHELLSR